MTPPVDPSTTTPSKAGAAPPKAAADVPPLKRKRGNPAPARAAAAAMRAFAEHGIAPNIFLGNQVNLAPKKPDLTQEKPKESEKVKWARVQLHFDQHLAHSCDRTNADSDNLRKELCKRYSKRDPKDDADLILQLLGELYLTRYPAPTIPPA